MTVLIVSLPDDTHAHAVRWAIERLGGKCDMFYPLDLSGGATWTWNSAEARLDIDHDNNVSSLHFDDYETIWMRRPPVTFPQEQLLERVERAISEADFAIFARSVYERLEEGKFVVNPTHQTRLANLKPYQFALASKAGLNLPETLISNSRDEVASFYQRLNGKVVYKPLRSAMWHITNGPVPRASIVPTSALTPELIAAADFTSAPGIFQQQIVKVAEVRATIMGRSVFAYSKSFSTRADLDVDWRFMHRAADLIVCDLPEKVKQSCFSLMDSLGLVFGCFDFAIDEAGEYHFFEVNPQGQWLWGDTLGIGLSQLDAMASFLISKDPQFTYAGNPLIDLADFPEETRLSMEQEDSLHYGNLKMFMYHQVSFRANPTIPIPFEPAEAEMAAER